MESTPQRTPTPAPAGVRTWTVWSPTGPVDVDVDAPDDAALGALEPALAAVLGRAAEGVWSGSDQLPGSTPLTSTALAHGARLGFGRPGPRETGPAASALELHVTGGPEAGRAVALSRGRLVIGRGAACGLSLDDADVSRRHALLEVGDGVITVADLGSANGSRLGSEEIGPQPQAWPPGVPLQVGASTLHLAGTTGGALPSSAVRGGRTVLRPQHRLSAPRVPVDVPFPAEPGQQARRRLGWVAVALPAVGGVVMAWVLSAPHFLFFALLSPLVALATWGSDRWSGRRGSRRAAAAHALEDAAAQARLAAAVAADGVAARSAAPDAATLAAAARRRSEPLWHRRRADPDALVVRVGTGPADTRVSRLDADGTRSPVTAPDLPVTVDLRSTEVLGLVGPRPLVQGVAATLLVQLTGLHPPGDVRLALLTRPEDVGSWAWARWLPHLSPPSVRCDPAGPAGDEQLQREMLRWVAAQRAGGGPELAGWLVVVVDRPLPPATAALLVEAAPAGVRCVCLGATVPELPVPPGAVLAVRGETGSSATLSRRDAQAQEVTALDLVPAATAAQFARRLAPLTVPREAAALPVAVRLTDLIGAPGAPGDAGPVRWSRTRGRLGAVIGRSANGVVEVDLCAQGPHALVAGTTGSGKSELLQTLVAGLAANHPPDRCTFLLVDYKGGAAFAEAALLPHTVGLVTDLDPQSTTRALRSLGAELARREQLLADHDVRDLAALPGEVPLARLVIVVDEFATLAEELPGFVSGLVGIAQRGRSLGVHLVLATQRPAGVVSPEIRANCTLRICLRTTDEADSRDVLGTPVAAHLPVELPGRAHLRCGTDTPTLLQVARVSTSAAQPEVTAPRVRLRGWPAPPERPPSATADDAETDLAALVTSLGAAAVQQRIAPPHRPWRPPLPDRLTAGDLAERVDRIERGVLHLGLVDRPDQQTQDVLTLDLADGGTWLALGGPRSGRTGLLRSVLAAATSSLPPSELQVHVLDHGGGALAAEAGALPHAGTTVARDDALRTVRLVRRLEEEVARRRALGADEVRPHLVLLVDGLESVSGLLDESDPTLGSAGLLRLARDGTAVGLTCVCTADRAVPGGRLAAVATRRLVLPLPDRADYTVAGVPVRAVPAHLPPGRALVGADGLECQLVLPPQQLHPAQDPPGVRPASGVRIPPLPAQAWLPRSGPGLGGDQPPRPGLWLPIGPGGDDGGVLGVDLRRSGGLLVAGPSGSGRTTALTAFTEHWDAAGVPLLRIGPAATSTTAPGTPDVPTVQDWAAGLGDGPGVVVVDDLAALPDPVADLLTTLCRPGRSLVVVGAGAPAELAATFRGPAMALRRARTGLVLRPAPGDADVLGIRLPRTPVADRPGSGWLVLAGTAQRVQVARRR